MKIERKLQEMGIELPDFGPSTYYGANYGKMKPFHRIGNLLVLPGTSPICPMARGCSPVGSGPR